MWQNIALILVGIGVLALIGWSAQSFFMSGDVPILIKIAVGAIGVGVLIFIGVAIKDRIAGAKKEDFKGVEK